MSTIRTGALKILGVILLLQFLYYNNCYAQKVSSGISMNLPCITWNSLKINDDIVFAANSYKAYKISRHSKTSFPGEYGGIGPSWKLDYGKCLFSLDALLSYKQMKFQFDYLIHNDSVDFDVGETMECAYLDLPFLFKKFFKSHRLLYPFAEAGLSYSIPLYYKDNSPYVLSETYSLNKSFACAIIGVGVGTTKGQFSFRFFKRIDYLTNKNVSMWDMKFNFTFYMKSKMLQKKR